MDESSTTTATLDQADDEILTCTVSDEALEAAAAGTGMRAGDTLLTLIRRQCCR